MRKSNKIIQDLGFNSEKLIDRRAERFQAMELSPIMKSFFVNELHRVKELVNDWMKNSIELTHHFGKVLEDFLDYIELLGEIKNKTESDLAVLDSFLAKLEFIGKSNQAINSNYSDEKDVLVISHRILLSKLKFNVNQAIDYKIQELDLARAVHQGVSRVIDKKNSELDVTISGNLFKYLNTNFELVAEIESLKEAFKIFEGITCDQEKKNLKYKEIISHKIGIITEYEVLFDRYLKKVESSFENKKR